MQSVSDKISISTVIREEKFYLVPGDKMHTFYSSISTGLAYIWKEESLGRSGVGRRDRMVKDHGAAISNGRGWRGRY